MRENGIRAALALALLAIAFTGTAQADTRLAHVTEPTLVNAYGGAVVWSSYDEANKVYRLTAYRHGRISTLPIPPSDSVFDADLGVDSNAKLTVVYSRCKAPREKLPFIVAPTTADCDLYMYRFGAAAEQKLTRLSRTGVSEYLPSIWGNNVAFARTQTNASGGDCISYVWLGNLRNGKQKRLAKGTLGSYKGPAPCHTNTMPTSIDMRAKVVAFSWYFSPSDCGDGSELWLVRTGRKTKKQKLESRCGGYRFTPVSLTRFRLFDMSSGSVIHPSVGYFTPNLRRFDLGSGAYFESRQRDSDSFAVSDGKQLYLLRQVGSEPEETGYDIVSKPMPSFERSRKDPG